MNHCGKHGQAKSCDYCISKKEPKETTNHYWNHPSHHTRHPRKEHHGKIYQTKHRMQRATYKQRSTRLVIHSILAFHTTASPLPLLAHYPPTTMILVGKQNNTEPSTARQQPPVKGHGISKRKNRRARAPQKGPRPRKKEKRKKKPTQRPKIQSQGRPSEWHRVHVFSHRIINHHHHPPPKTII